MIPSIDPTARTSYQIYFNRVFFQYQPPSEIDAELADVEPRILALLREVTE